MYHHAYAATRAWRCSSATPSLPNTLHTVLKSVTSSQVLLVGSRAWCSTAAEPPPHRVAIIGSGPAGFYTAKYLLRGADHVHVDVYDRLPTPFGLVRYGVAPDHPEVKSVINDFREVATSDKFGFVGGLAVGTEQPHGGPCVTVEELSQHYAAVVFAVGAQVWLQWMVYSCLWRRVVTIVVVVVLVCCRERSHWVCQVVTVSQTCCLLDSLSTGEFTMCR